MAELVKVIILFFGRMILVKSGLLGSFGKANKRRDLFESNHPPERYNEEVSAFITGMIQLLFTALGCLIVRHTISSIANNFKSYMSELDTSHAQQNVTQYLKPNTTLNSYEIQIVQDSLILPNKISNNFNQIGGLSAIKQSLIDIANDFTLSNLADDSIIQPTGFLLSGPPGSTIYHSTKRH